MLREEGLENAIERHQRNHRALVAGLEAMGLSMAVDQPWRLPQLNAVCIPEGVDDARCAAACCRTSIWRSVPASVRSPARPGASASWDTPAGNATLSSASTALEAVLQQEAGMRSGPGSTAESGAALQAASDVWAREAA
jgi:alanine-glyoxylate transaminase/serine-glyoxylate transaminase/serine-pyruvate transaminase